jgi:hypothetical protein
LRKHYGETFSRRAVSKARGIFNPHAQAEQSARFVMEHDESGSFADSIRALNAT